MPRRSAAQQIGSAAEAIVEAIAEEHGAWIARQQHKDFGVDLEFELADPEVEGFLLKVQVKGSRDLPIDGDSVVVGLETKYARLAENLRLPFIHVWVDVSRRKCWYLWLQRWMLEQEATGLVVGTQDALTLKVPTTQTLTCGLYGELKDIARFNTPTQLALTVRDALKTATSVGDVQLQDLHLFPSVCRGDTGERRVTGEGIARMWT